MFSIVARYSVLLLLLFMAVPAFAQSNVAVSTSKEAVALFTLSCMPYAGRTNELRKWIDDHYLPKAPDTFAHAYTNGKPAQAFFAGSITNKIVLVSTDDGACFVIGMQGDLETAAQALSDNFEKFHLAIKPYTEKENFSGETAQKMFSVSSDSRKWLVSITTHAHKDDPSYAPELDLVATPAD